MSDENYFLYRNTIHALLMQDWSTKASLMVYEILSDLSHFQEIDIGYKEISKKTGLNRTTIRRSINLLIKHEYIRISTEYERGKQCRGYKLLKPTTMSEIKGLKVSKMKGSKNGTIKGIKNGTIKGSKNEPYLNTNTHGTQKINNKKEEIDFEELKKSSLKKRKKRKKRGSKNSNYFTSKKYLEEVRKKGEELNE